MLDETAAAPQLLIDDHILPEAPQGEGGPIALMGDPPLSTNTEVFIAAPAVAEQLAAVTAPAPEPEKTVDFGKGMKVPYSMVRSFASPTCRNHCQQGLIVQPGKTTAAFCFCALKGCRDAIVGARSARAAARPLPGVSTQVNARSLESLEKLTARVARLDEQIAQRDAEAADEIAALLASADTGEGKAAEYTRGIRQAEEGLEASAERRRDLERQIRESEEADADVTAKLTAARASEAEIVGKVAAIRRQAEVLKGKRDQRTAGMRREREKLQRRVNLRLAHQPAVAVPEASPAPAPATPQESVNTSGLVYTLPDPAPVVESSSAPAGPPEEKTPVVEVLVPAEASLHGETPA